MLNTFSQRMLSRALLEMKAHTISSEYAYFFFYSWVRGSYIKRLTARLPKGSRTPVLSTAAELLLSALAGALAQIFTIPVSVIATRQQIGTSIDKARRKSAPQIPKPNGEPAKALNGDVEKALTSTEEALDSEVPSSQETPYDDSFLAVAREIIEEEGPTGLWLGLKPGLVLTANPAITYGCYERVKSALLLAQEKATGKLDTKLSPWMTFGVGAISKTLATIVRDISLASSGLMLTTNDSSRSPTHISWPRYASRLVLPMKTMPSSHISTSLNLIILTISTGNTSVLSLSFTEYS